MGPEVPTSGPVSSLMETENTSTDLPGPDRLVPLVSHRALPATSHTLEIFDSLLPWGLWSGFIALKGTEDARAQPLQASRLSLNKPAPSS